MVCSARKRFLPFKIRFLGLIYRVLKSVVFNLLMIGLGVAIGYQIFVDREYLKFVNNQDVRHIEEIHRIMNEHIRLNQEMNSHFQQLKMSSQKKDN